MDDDGQRGKGWAIAFAWRYRTTSPLRCGATGKSGDGATFKRYLKVQLLSNPYKFTCQGLLDT
jgi:hypothetical protein